MRVWAFRAAAVLWCVLIFWLSSQSDPPVPGFFDIIPYWDKFAHAGLYGVMCVLWRAGFFRGGGARGWAGAAGWCAIYGMSDEFHQRYVPGRTPDITDLIADVCGALLAAAAMRLLASRYEKIKYDSGKTL